MLELFKRRTGIAPWLFNANYIMSWISSSGVG
jgi:hypothetical protein